MIGQLIAREAARLKLMPANPSRNVKSRILSFEAYQERHARPWHMPDLSGWALELLSRGMAQASVKSYLGAVRGPIARLTKTHSGRCCIAWLQRMRQPQTGKHW